jgi:hypothetical protein
MKMDIRIAKIKKNLQKGLYVENLSEIRHQCMEMAKEMEQRISGALKDVIDGFIENQELKQMWNSLNALLRSFLQVEKYTVLCQMEVFPSIICEPIGWK